MAAGPRVAGAEVAGAGSYCNGTGFRGRFGLPLPRPLRAVRRHQHPLSLAEDSIAGAGDCRNVSFIMPHLMRSGVLQRRARRHRPPLHRCTVSASSPKRCYGMLFSSCCGEHLLPALASTRFTVHPPKPPPGEPCAEAARQSNRGVHEEVDLLDAAFKVIALACVGLRHGAAKRRRIAGKHGIARLQYTRVFSLITCRQRRIAARRTSRVRMRRVDRALRRPGHEDAESVCATPSGRPQARLRRRP